MLSVRAGRNSRGRRRRSQKRRHLRVPWPTEGTRSRMRGGSGAEGRSWPPEDERTWRDREEGKSRRYRARPKMSNEEVIPRFKRQIWRRAGGRY